MDRLPIDVIRLIQNALDTRSWCNLLACCKKMRDIGLTSKKQRQREYIAEEHKAESKRLDRCKGIAALESMSRMQNVLIVGESGSGKSFAFHKMMHETFCDSVRYYLCTNDSTFRSRLAQKCQLRQEVAVIDERLMLSTIKDMLQEERRMIQPIMFVFKYQNGSLPCHLEHFVSKLDKSKLESINVYVTVFSWPVPSLDVLKLFPIILVDAYYFESDLQCLLERLDKRDSEALREKCYGTFSQLDPEEFYVINVESHHVHALGRRQIIKCFT